VAEFKLQFRQFRSEANLATDPDIFVYFPKCLAPPLRGNLFHLSRERFLKYQFTMKINEKNAGE